MHFLPCSCTASLTIRAARLVCPDTAFLHKVLSSHSAWPGASDKRVFNQFTEDAYCEKKRCLHFRISCTNIHLSAVSVEMYSGVCSPSSCFSRLFAACSSLLLLPVLAIAGPSSLHTSPVPQCHAAGLFCNGASSDCLLFFFSFLMAF